MAARGHGGHMRKALQRSLATRMALAVFCAGLGLTILLLVVVTAWIRSEVLSDRQQAIVADAHRHAVTMQDTFNGLSAEDVADITATAQQRLTRIRETSRGAGGVGVMLMRDPHEDATVVMNDMTTDARLVELLTPDLMNATSAAAPGTEVWQSIGLPTDTDSALPAMNGDSPRGGSGDADSASPSTISGNSSAGKAAGKSGAASRDPGIVVGSSVSLPMVGHYNLYVFYSLRTEQNMIDGATRAIILGGLGFMLILVVGMWGLSWYVLTPVRRTALAAERLASGKLDERLPEYGSDELAGLARSFNEMATAIESHIERLESLSAVQRHFVSDVSHELRSPLATISMATERLYESRDTFTDPLAVRSAELLHSQVDRFDHMLSELLEISRIDSGRVELRLGEVNVGDVVADVIEHAAIHAQERGVEIVTSCTPEIITIQAEAVRITRIVRNLVVNAIEHAEGRPVHVDVAANDFWACVRVSDRGVGMSPEVVEHVFDRFFRADPSRQRTLGGTGLGLSIALEDAHLHGGSLRAWGAEGFGSVFLLTVPICPDEPASAGVLPPLSLVPPDAPGRDDADEQLPASPPVSERSRTTVLGPTPISRRSVE